jgi:amino acid adenylation domain-containing protein/non-ribosomal peptide synthase protein (TIGR01720 family)
VQFIGRRLTLPVNWLDWSAAPQPDKQAKLLADWLRDDAARPFDLSRPPLMRLTIATLGAQRYRWLWSFHHILLDGWSMPIFFRELLAIYAGGAANLSPPRPITDHLAWLALRDGGASRQRWRDRLADLQPALLAAPARGQARVERCEIVLARAATDAIEQLARASGVTVSTVFNAAWALLLARSGLGSDVAFGVTLSGRSGGLRGVDGMIGLFINTLPLRVTLAPGQTASALLARVQQSLADLHASEHERLSEILRAADAGTSALFDTLVVFENYPVEGDFAGPDGLQFTWPDYREHTNYPVTLAIIPGERITLRLEHDANRYSSSQATALVERLVRLLGEMCATPERAIAMMNGGDTSGPSQAPDATNTTASTSVLLAHHLFDRAATRSPQATALLSPAGVVSYAELARRANAIAVQLRRRGAGLDTVVGVMLPRGTDAIAALLGVMKAGAAYLPLDLHYPAGRVSYMLRDSGAPFVISKPDLKLTDAGNAVLLRLGHELRYEDHSDFDAGDEALTPPPQPSSSLAYVIYTSGSTGHPKAVGVTHAGIENMCREMRAGFAVEPRSRIFLFPPLSFDASIAEIFTALTSGAALVLPPEDAVQSDTSTALIDAAGDGKVTHVTLPPSLLATLTEPDLAGVETIVAAGEAAPAGLLARWARGRRVVNAYGPSETTVCASMQVCDTQEQLPSIGKGIGGVEMVVLDDWLGVAPTGVAGEIYLGGPSLARGYLGRPGLTATSFVPHPTSVAPGARLYRTGDRGVWLADGSVRYLGRKGGHIKLRGYRIDPDGIAGALLRHPAVREALVVVSEDGQRPELLAYLIPRNESLNTAEVRAHASRELAPHEVPARFITVQNWPLTASGKIDRAKLQEEHAGHPQAGEPATDGEPRDQAEAWFRDAFRQVLGVPDAGVEDDYFALGGDSILALQVSTIMRRHGLKVGPGEVLELRTPRALAQASRERAGDARADNYEAEQEHAEVVLAPIQRWFLERGGYTPRRLTLDVRLRLAAPLDPAALAGALAALPLRHDALRLRVEHAAQGWRQHYASRSDVDLFPLAILPGRALGEPELQACAAAMQAALDPVHGPMTRAAYVPEGPYGVPELILIAHHLVMDVASWRILLADLDSCYAAAMCGEPMPAPPMTTSYRRWNEALRDTAPARAGERQFWQKMIGADHAAGRDVVGPADLVSSVKTVWLHFEPALTALLNGPLNGVHGTRTQELLLTAFARSWWRWTDNAALRLDIEGHGRQVPASSGFDLTQTVGWFTCLYPLHLEHQYDWDALVLRVRNLLRSVPDGGIGFGVLSHLDGPDTFADPNPRLVSWNYLGAAADGEASELPSLGARLAADALPDGRAPGDTVLHPLAINASITAGKLSISFAHSDERLDEQGTHSVQRLASLMDEAVRDLREHLSQKFGATGLAQQSLPGADLLEPAELDALIFDITDPE